jgi:hypothetical protein
MLPTTLSKFDVSVLEPMVNLGIVTENARAHGVGAIVALPEHIGALLVQRGMMRAGHKVICALDFQGRYFGLDKLTRLKDNPLGCDGYEIMLSPGRTSIELLNEIKVLTNFIRGNNPRAEIRWVINMAQRKPEELTEVFKHLGQAPPTAIRMYFWKPQSPEDVNQLIATARKSTTAPFKIDGDPTLVKAFIGHRDIKGFDISHAKLLETAKLIDNLNNFPAAKKAIDQMTVDDLNKVLSNISGGETIAPPTEQLSEYIRRCQALGPSAVEAMEYFEVLRTEATAGKET